MKPLLLLLALSLLIWSRTTAGATAVQSSNASEPVEALSDFADQALAAVIGWEIPARGEPYRPAIDSAEIVYGIPHNLLARVLYQESRYRPDIISGELRSSAGAVGIAQFMPATAAQFRIDPRDPFASIDAAGKYLSQLYAQFGSWSLALAAYNYGPGNVARVGLVGAPEETQVYVAEIAADVPIA